MSTVCHSTPAFYNLYISKTLLNITAATAAHIYAKLLGLHNVDRNLRGERVRSVVLMFVFYFCKGFATDLNREVNPNRWNEGVYRLYLYGQDGYLQKYLDFFHSIPKVEWVDAAVLQLPFSIGSVVKMQVFTSHVSCLTDQNCSSLCQPIQFYMGPHFRTNDCSFEELKGELILLYHCYQKELIQHRVAALVGW